MRTLVAVHEIFFILYKSIKDKKNSPLTAPWGVLQSIAIGVAVAGGLEAPQSPIKVSLCLLSLSSKERVSRRTGKRGFVA